MESYLIPPVRPGLMVIVMNSAFISIPDERFFSLLRVEHRTMPVEKELARRKKKNTQFLR